MKKANVHTIQLKLLHFSGFFYERGESLFGCRDASFCSEQVIFKEIARSDVVEPQRDLQYED